MEFAHSIACQKRGQVLCRATSVIPKTMVAIGMIGFTLVDTIKWPAPFVVLLGGALGLLGGVLRAP